MMAAWTALTTASLAGLAMALVLVAAIVVGRRLRRASTAPDQWVHDTTDGVPLGLSVDYDHLPVLELERVVRCTTCDGLHVDAERREPRGGRVLAVMCRGCRDRGRARWVAVHAAPLPRATIERRSCR